MLAAAAVAFCCHMQILTGRQVATSSLSLCLFHSLSVSLSLGALDLVADAALNYFLGRQSTINIILTRLLGGVWGNEKWAKFFMQRYLRCVALRLVATGNLQQENEQEKKQVQWGTPHSALGTRMTLLAMRPCQCPMPSTTSFLFPDICGRFYGTVYGVSTVMGVSPWSLMHELA